MISIIVPTYNSEKYLSRCIASVLAQSYRDFELIIVDDGSTDNSKTICKEFSCTDNRVKYYYQDNQGASAARNNGIRRACGEYILFCDSDDEVSENWASNIMNFSGRDTFCMCSSCSGKASLGCQKPLNVDPEKRYDASDYYEFNNCGLAGYIWNGAFCAEIIKNNHLLFREHREEGDYNEDLLFTLSYVKHMRYIVYNGFSDYLYDTRMDSLSRSNRTYYFEKYIEKYCLWENFLRTEGKSEDIPVLARKTMYHVILSLHSCSVDSDRKKFNCIMNNAVLKNVVTCWDGGTENPIEIKLIKKRKKFLLWMFYWVTNKKFLSKSKQ